MLVDLSRGTFATGQLYVALSGCTSSAGLVLQRDVLPKDLPSDPRVRRFLTANTDAPSARGHAYLGMFTAGNEDRMSRPRPIELAVVTEEGDEHSTLMNPTSDLYDARTEYGITVADVQFAPVLTEAWQALEHLLAGRIPAAVEVGRVLRPGVRVCFTGTVITPDARRLERPEMEALAAAGLVPVANVTKTRCDVLVVAEAGTQSGKAKRVLQYGKPVITAGEFLAHVSR